MEKLLNGRRVEVCHALNQSGVFRSPEMIADTLKIMEFVEQSGGRTTAAKSVEMLLNIIRAL